MEGEGSDIAYMIQEIIQIVPDQLFLASHLWCMWEE